MKRAAARAFFAIAATTTAGALFLAAAFVLSGGPPPTQPSDIRLVRLDAMQPNEVVLVKAKELSGLDRLANAQRERTHQTLWSPRSRPAGMPVFIVRTSDDDVHAFLGVDPRTGCDLEYDSRRVAGSIVFVDVCHGSGYDLSGRPTRGPGSWHLDELVLHIRDGFVFADVHKIIAGGIAIPGY